MFEGLMKPKFQSKCKSYLRLLKTRLDSIRRKKNSVQKFLKNDVADLLRNGLDINAYGRVEGLLIEQNISSCYQLVDNFCGCITSHLSLMQKQCECPKECKEAVASLIYAAARFGDLPELRDLRKMFTEKYKDCLEAYTNKELMEKLKGHSPSKEMKLQAMQEIANEFSIEWDTKALEQKLYTPPPVQPKYGPLSNNDDGLHKYQKSKEATLHQKDHGNKMNVYKANQESESDDETRNSSTTTSVGSISDEDADGKKPFYYKYIRPPYLKPKANETDESAKTDDKPKPRSVRRMFKSTHSQDNAETKTTAESNRQSGLFWRGRDATADSEATSHRGCKSESAESQLPTRALSLPPEDYMSKTGSFQSEVLQAHPKLPDYDELAARIAALK